MPASGGSWWSDSKRAAGHNLAVKPLPALPDGAIDWDLVGVRYHDHVLSPFAPEMVESRNLLLNALRTMDLHGLRVADLGCGPGNLMPYLAGRVERITLVDLSERSLELAEAAAEEAEIAAEVYRQDLRSLEIPGQFDIVVSVNSILPPTRSDVVGILRCVHRLLAPGGRFLAILPSYDTTVYLRALTGEAPAARLADDKNLAYADDGAHVQSYHTPESIERELSEAGLVLDEPPQKVYYPWELTRRHGYGHFPDAPEQIWDWYVKAGRAGMMDHK